MGSEAGLNRAVALLLGLESLPPFQRALLRLRSLRLLREEQERDRTGMLFADGQALIQDHECAVE